MYGPERDRASKAQWMAKQPCAECAVAAATDNGLPALMGSDKQITWAETIRARTLPDLRTKAERAYKTVDEADAILADPARMAEATAKVGSLEGAVKGFTSIKARAQAIIDTYDRAAGETSAKWWIDQYR
jgi:hypothetical protein